MEKYKNGVVAKLAMKVSEYYGAALSASNEGLPAASAYLPGVSRLQEKLVRREMMAP